MEESNKITPKLAVVSVLIATVLTGISVAFGYFLWTSMQNTDISFTVEGAIVQLNDGADIMGANLVPVKSYTSNGAVKKNIGIKLKEDVTDTVTVTMKLNINEISQYLAISDFKWTLVKDTTVVSEGTFNGKSNNDVIELVTLSSDNTDSNKKLTTILSNYILYLWIDGNNANDSNMQNQSFDFTLTVEGTNSALGRFPAAKVIEMLDDGSNGDTGSGVYKVEHEAIGADVSVTGAVIPASTDYRYYGANPNNYVCLDFEGSTTCPDKHLYRIIGSIYDELEGTNKLKVIKATTLKAGDGSTGTVTKFAWNQTTATDNASYRQNIWAPVTDSTTGYSNAKELPSTGRDNSGSTLMEMLNSEGDNGLWWGGKSGTMYYYDSGMQTKTVDFSGDEYKMESDVLDMISTTRYYLAGHNSNQITPETMYTYERTTTGYNNGRYNDVRPYYWDGKVAVMYPSDYGYAAGETCATGTNLYNYSTSGCKNTDWLWYTSDHQWFLSPNSSGTDVAFSVVTMGNVNNYGNVVLNGCSVRPVFSLKPEVIITEGDGTIDNPYRVE